jgi:hypothetical protein
VLHPGRDRQGTPHLHQGHDDHIGALDVTSNGRIIATNENRNKIVLYDGDGKKLLEVDAPRPMSATGLPNGHFLVASHDRQRVLEVSGSGKIVWELPNAGKSSQARRR